MIVTSVSLTTQVNKSIGLTLTSSIQSSNIGAFLQLADKCTAHRLSLMHAHWYLIQYMKCLHTAKKQEADEQFFILYKIIIAAIFWCLVCVCTVLGSHCSVCTVHG